MRRVVVVPDIQAPYHSQRAVTTLAKFIRETAPDDVYCVGDVLDAPQVGRWNRGQKGEFEGNLGKHRDIAVRVLDELQVTHLSRSNHDDRVQNYVERVAPGLLDLPELGLRSFLKLDDLGIKLHSKPWEFAPDWYLMHGDEGGMSQIAGATALLLAKKIGASVVCGHTHRMGICPDTDSVNGQVKRIKVGVECGTLMQLGKADYVTKQAGAANWQMGFVVLDIAGSRVQPYPVFMDSRNGSFIFEGRLWS